MRFTKNELSFLHLALSMVDGSEFTSRASDDEIRIFYKCLHHLQDRVFEAAEDKNGTKTNLNVCMRYAVRNNLVKFEQKVIFE